MKNPQLKNLSDTTQLKNEGNTQEGLTMAPPAFSLSATPVQTKPNPTPPSVQPNTNHAGNAAAETDTDETTAPKGPSEKSESWMRKTMATYGESMNNWPLHERLRYEVYDFNDSKGLKALPDMIVQAGPISDANEKEGVLSLIREMYPNSESGDPSTLGALLLSYVEGGFEAISELSPDQDPEQAYKEGGFEGMAKYIASKTKKDRPGAAPKYVHEEGSLRLAEQTETMAALHDMGYWKDLSRRVVKIAAAEHKAWMKEDGSMYRETDAPMYANLEKYWATTRNERGTKRMADLSVKGDHYAMWSAAFISWVYEEAGAGDTFASGDSHGIYSSAADDNKKTGASKVNQPQRTFAADGGQKVHIGGLLHRDRGTAKPKLRNSPHSDIVVDIEVRDAGGARIDSYDSFATQATSGLAAQDQARLETLGKDAFLVQYLNGNNPASQVYQLFAVTIGGNTNNEGAHDMNIPTQNIPKGERRTWSENKALTTSGTVGKRFWALKADRTVDHENIKEKTKMLGIQRQDLPEQAEIDAAL